MFVRRWFSIMAFSVMCCVCVFLSWQLMGLLFYQTVQLQETALIRILFETSTYSISLFMMFFSLIGLWRHWTALNMLRYAMNSYCLYVTVCFMLFFYMNDISKAFLPDVILSLVVTLVVWAGILRGLIYFSTMEIKNNIVFGGIVISNFLSVIMIVGSFLIL